MTIIRSRDLIRCRFPTAADPVVKGAYCNVVFTTPVGICHAALAAFIDEYYGAAEPPVRCGVSHLSGLTEPPVYSYSA